LRAKGYRRHVEKASSLPKAYRGFWRGAEADGVWSHDGAPVRHIALESKLNEDSKAPLSQILDHLAHVLSPGVSAGAVHVRVHRAKRKAGQRTEAMDQLENSMLVRYLDVSLDV